MIYDFPAKFIPSVYLWNNSSLVLFSMMCLMCCESIYHLLKIITNRTGSCPVQLNWLCNFSLTVAYYSIQFRTNFIELCLKHVRNHSPLGKHFPKAFPVDMIIKAWEQGWHIICRLAPISSNVHNAIKTNLRSTCIWFNLMYQVKGDSLNQNIRSGSEMPSYNLGWKTAAHVFAGPRHAISKERKKQTNKLSEN